MYGTDLNFEPTARTFRYVGEDDSRRRVYGRRPSRQRQVRAALRMQGWRS